MKIAILVWSMVFAILGSTFAYRHWNEGKPASANDLTYLSTCAKKAASEVTGRNEIVTGRQIKEFEASCNSPSQSAQDQATALR